MRSKAGLEAANNLNFKKEACWLFTGFLLQNQSEKFHPKITILSTRTLHIMKSFKAFKKQDAIPAFPFERHLSTFHSIQLE